MHLFPGDRVNQVQGQRDGRAAGASQRQQVGDFLMTSKTGRAALSTATDLNTAHGEGLASTRDPPERKTGSEHPMLKTRSYAHGHFYIPIVPGLFFQRGSFLLPNIQKVIQALGASAVQAKAASHTAAGRTKMPPWTGRHPGGNRLLPFRPLRSHRQPPCRHGTADLPRKVSTPTTSATSPAGFQQSTLLLQHQAVLLLTWLGKEQKEKKKGTTPPEWTTARFLSPRVDSAEGVPSDGLCLPRVLCPSQGKACCGVPGDPCTPLVCSPSLSPTMPLLTCQPQTPERAAAAAATRHKQKPPGLGKARSVLVPPLLTATLAPKLCGHRQDVAAFIPPPRTHTHTTSWKL